MNRPDPCILAVTDRRTLNRFEADPVPLTGFGQIDRRKPTLADHPIADELAKCIGALRGVADIMLKDHRPHSAASLREIADDAFAVLAEATRSSDAP